MSATLQPAKQASAPGAGVPTIWLDGKWYDRDTATVSVYDHGLLYGDGVFEGIRIYGGKIFRLAEHLERLYDSAHAIWMTVPMPRDEMATVTEEAVRRSGITEGYIRHIVTRGVGDLTYDPQATPKPSVVIIVKPQIDPPPEAYERGVRTVIVDIVRNHPGTVNPMIKSNNLMNSALAMQEALRRGAFEGIMRNYRGELTECTTSNLFIVRNGAALTPPLTSGLLPGTRRDFIFDVGKDVGVEVREEVLRDEDLFSADEAFLTSTTREAVPIVTVDDRTIGTGTPGPVTKRLLEGFRRRAHANASTGGQEQNRLRSP